MNQFSLDIIHRTINTLSKFGVIQGSRIVYFGGILMVFRGAWGMKHRYISEIMNLSSTIQFLTQYHMVYLWVS